MLNSKKQLKYHVSSMKAKHTNENNSMEPRAFNKYLQKSGSRMEAPQCSSYRTGTMFLVKAYSPLYFSAPRSRYSTYIDFRNPLNSNIREGGGISEQAYFEIVQTAITTAHRKVISGRGCVLSFVNNISLVSLVKVVLKKWKCEVESGVLYWSTTCIGQTLDGVLPLHSTLPCNPRSE